MCYWVNPRAKERKSRTGQRDKLGYDADSRDTTDSAELLMWGRPSKLLHTGRRGWVFILLHRSVIGHRPHQKGRSSCVRWPQL